MAASFGQATSQARDVHRCPLPHRDLEVSRPTISLVERVRLSEHGGAPLPAAGR